MTPDSNGILMLEETDPITPFQTTINSLQAATSEAIGDVIEGIDERFDKTAVRMAAGTVTITAPVGGTGVATATFPAGRFTVAPIVWTNTRTTAPMTFPSQCSSATTSSASIRLSDTRSSGSAVAVTVEWVAIQMTPTSAEG